MSWFYLLLFFRTVYSFNSNTNEMLLPPLVLRHVPFSVRFVLPALKNGSVYPEVVNYEIFCDSEKMASGLYSTKDKFGNFQTEIAFSVDHLILNSTGTANLTGVVYSKDRVLGKTTRNLYVVLGWMCLLPPMMTLIVSGVVQNVLVALLAGIWCGATILNRWDFYTGFKRTFDYYWVHAFTNDGHAGVLLFTIILGGTIGIVQKGGGGHGLAKLANQWMTNRFRMQFFSWLLCLCIFFDDFSCILIIGNALKGLLKDVGVSREKFSIILHVVGVCLPSLSPISSWIGVEIGYIAAQLHGLNIHKDPFMTCLSTITYRFFPILFIGFILLLILFEKDFGAIVPYEKLAIQAKIQSDQQLMMENTEQNIMDGPLSPNKDAPQRWYNAAIPFLLIIVLTFFGMINDGISKLDLIYPNASHSSYSLLTILSHSDSVGALIQSSASGCFVAMVLVIVQKILTLNQTVSAWIQGVNDILEPTIILLLAWALGTVIQDIQIAPYLATIIEGNVSPGSLPAITAILCYIVSFATGSGFGTMAIMFPIISPLAYQISNQDVDNLLQCFGAIIGSATFGNICSPIADTSILAALSSSVPLLVHIQVILPYTLLVGSISVLFAYLPLGLCLYSSFVSFLVCFTILSVVIFTFGKDVEQEYHQQRLLQTEESHLLP